MSKARISMVTILVCAVALSGCMTTPKSAPVTDWTECIIETQEPDVIVEVKLDGKLIFSGKTNHEEHGNFAFCKFATWLGHHQLAVAAPGHETWYREVTLVGGSKFWAKLATK